MSEGAQSGWSRAVALDRVLNCRDLGGYPTRSGKRVRTGAVFRSGDLGAPSDDDLERLRALGVACMFDMRSNRERSDRPNLGAPGLGVPLMTRDYDHSRANLIQKAREGTAVAEEVAALMIETYRRLPYEQAESIGTIFRAIADRRLPLLFHCAAGKDRTGVASALLLDLLGVERETVFEDFLLTNAFFDRIMRRFLVKGRFGDDQRDLWTPMIRAERPYLEAMFAEVEARHGGTETYLAEIAGVDAGTRERIRDALLETA